VRIGKTAGLVIAFVAGIVALPLILLVAGFAGWIPTDAIHDPPQTEVAVAQKALGVSLAHRAAGLSNPLRGSDADLLAGMKQYRDDCSGCHGRFGRRSLWGTTSFYPRVPQFAQRPPPLSAPQMFVAVKYGIRYSGMGAWGKLMSDREIWQVVTFLSRLDSLPPKVKEEWTKPKSAT
jgi:mono/diheme cytochrome c family protein